MVRDNGEKEIRQNSECKWKLSTYKHKNKHALLFSKTICFVTHLISAHSEGLKLKSEQGSVNVEKPLQQGM